MTFKIITDSSSGLTAEKLGAWSAYIDVLPLIIVFGEKDYHDCAEDIPYDTFEKVLRDPVITVSTSQVPPHVFRKKCMEAFKEVDQVLFLGLSSKISGQHNSITKMVAEDEELKGKVYVYDTKSILEPLVKMNFTALKLLQAGKSMGEVIMELDRIKYSYKLLFEVNDISYLEKGGRCSSTVVAFCKVFKIIPILEFANGMIVKYGKFRTIKRAIDRCINIIAKEYGTNEITIYLGYISEDVVDMIKESVLKFKFKVVNYEHVPRVLSSHTGPETIGFLGMTSYDSEE